MKIFVGDEGIRVSNNYFYINFYSCYYIHQAAKISEKGRGVKSTRYFKKGEYIVEYAGELISGNEAKLREKTYNSSQCYMFFFEDKGKKLW